MDERLADIPVGSVVGAAIAAAILVSCHAPTVGSSSVPTVSVGSRPNASPKPPSSKVQPVQPSLATIAAGFDLGTSDAWQGVLRQHDQRAGAVAPPILVSLLAEFGKREFNHVERFVYEQGRVKMGWAADLWVDEDGPAGIRQLASALRTRGFDETAQGLYSRETPTCIEMVRLSEGVELRSAQEVDYQITSTAQLPQPPTLAELLKVLPYFRHPTLEEEVVRALADARVLAMSVDGSRAESDSHANLILVGRDISDLERRVSDALASKALRPLIEITLPPSVAATRSSTRHERRLVAA